MKPRHARAIRAGIQAARQHVRPVMFANDLMAAAYWRTVDAMNKKAASRTFYVIQRSSRRGTPMLLRRPPGAGETFTHTTTPTAADKAAGDKPARFKGEQ